MDNGLNQLPLVIIFFQIPLKVNTSHVANTVNEIGALPTFTPSHTCPIIVRVGMIFFPPHRKLQNLALSPSFLNNLK